MQTAIQWLETASTQEGAGAILDFMRTQDGFIGGRILPPASSNPGWRIQSFHDADGIAPDALLPDGVRLVMVPDSLLRAVSPAFGRGFDSGAQWHSALVEYSARGRYIPLTTQPRDAPHTAP